MVFASCAYIFASTNIDQFCHASSDHFRNYKLASSEHFVIFRQLVRCFAPRILADTFKAGQYVKILSRFNHSQQLTAKYVLCDMPFDAEFFYLASRKSGE